MHRNFACLIAKSRVKIKQMKEKRRFKREMQLLWAEKHGSRYLRQRDLCKRD